MLLQICGARQSYPWADGIGIEYSHHEVAPSQHEIDMRYTDALTMADSVMTYRLVVKQVCYQSRSICYIYAQAVFGINGSGMHVHQSLFKGDKNAFFDPKGKYYLSKSARVISRSFEICSGNYRHQQPVDQNSYKRLVPGYEAPVYLSWAKRNRSDLIRVPEIPPG